MNRLLNKWIRLVHRWMTPPFIPILMIANMAGGTALGDLAQAIVVPLTIVFSITGGYLWLVTLVARRRKGSRTAEARMGGMQYVSN